VQHEEQTIRSFVSRQKRGRYLTFVSHSKTRSKFTHTLAHFRDIDPSCKRLIPPSKQNPKEIARILAAKGAGALCYVITEHPEFDGQELPLMDALEEIVGRGMGTILSCIPGRLAFMETEDERFILEKLKPPTRPKLCVRFIAPHIDSDSGVREGIFVAAYRLRDEGDMPPYQRDQLRSLLEWFSEHLPVPTPLENARNRTAISWFRCDSKDSISRVWSLVHILEDHGIVVDKITTENPGQVIYEDRWQVVAKP
jgi:hypothetical protein